MYAVRGEIVVKKAPESLLGTYGIYHDSAESRGRGRSDCRHISSTSTHRWIAELLANRLRKTGHVPEQTQVEHITSLEQADKYTGPSKQKVDVFRYRRPDLPALLDSKVPEGGELLGGEARLWKEFRIPTPYVYVATIGRLLSEVEFEPGEGWHDTHDEVHGKSMTFGLVTPVLYAAVNQTNTGSRDYR